MKTMYVLIAGLIIFLGIHSVRIVAPRWRDERYAAMGEGPWKGIYSIISLAGLVLIVIGFGYAREAGTADLFDPPEWGRTLTHIVMPIALILLIASNFPPGYIKRAVRHPLLVATLLWSGAHLLANGDTASGLLFGLFLIWALVDLISVSRRPSGPAPETKIWPDIIAVALGLLISWLLAAWLHVWAFGVPV